MRSDVTEIPVSDLHFDVENPRMVEFEKIRGTADEEEIVKVLWRTMNVNELVLSICASGYFSNDPLIITKESGKNVVIEGNRRLAAVKILLNPEKYPEFSVPDCRADLKTEIETLPTVEKDRRSAFNFIGFKHVNGPAKWNSYAKSKYIARVHNELGVSLDSLAQTIGDTHKTVKRLYRGLMVLEQAEKDTTFSREDAAKARLPFSHLYTGLGYSGFAEFLHLRSEDEETKEFVPPEKKGELEEVCFWLFGSRKQDKPPVIRSQNPDLRNLESVLRNPEATATLRDSRNLSEALELTRSPLEVFQQELLSSKTKLRKIKGLVPEGYDGSKKMLTHAGTVANLADSIYGEMEQKYKSSSREDEKHRLAEDE